MQRAGICVLVLLIMNLDFVSSGPICYASCLGTIGVGSLVGTVALLPALGFTSSGIAAGSWAATWMASFGGAVPAGSLFATLQSAGVAGASASTWTAISGGATGLCAALCAAIP